MTKHRALVAVLLPIAIVAGIVANLQFRSPYAVRQFERISVGMTRAEIEAMWGEPQTTLEDFSGRWAIFDAPPLRTLGNRIDPHADHEFLWKIDNGYWGRVVFDQTECVRRAELRVAPAHRPGSTSCEIG